MTFYLKGIDIEKLKGEITQSEIDGDLDKSKNLKWILENHSPLENYSNGDRENIFSCMLSILDSLKLYDVGALELGDETLSQVMFRKMSAYNIDLNKELGFNHLKPVIKK
jgi:hypothetical protein